MRSSRTLLPLSYNFHGLLKAELRLENDLPDFKFSFDQLFNEICGHDTARWKLPDMRLKSMEDFAQFTKTIKPVLHLNMHMKYN